MLNYMQEKAVKSFAHWYRNPESRSRPWFEISGPAGSGKTFTVKQIIEFLGLDYDDVLFCAYVGKAALALRLSGVNGRTIHSLIYHPEITYKKDEDDNVIYGVDGKPERKTVFIKNVSLPGNVKLIVVDEGGMVEKNMATDLLSFGIPLLVLGDLNQLPPVFGQGLFLLKPDIVLNEIMRQAKDSKIIYLSQLAIHGYPIPYGRHDKHVQVLRKNDVLNDYDLADEVFGESDMIITHTNTMRDNINRYVRKRIYHLEGNRIQVGDKIICRKNNWDILLPNYDNEIALVNGMIGYVSDIGRTAQGMEISFTPDFSSGQSFDEIPFDPNFIFMDYQDRKQVNPMTMSYIPFEFGYAITCHLSQGSQAETCCTFSENHFDTIMYRKWLYTAITRAKTNLSLIV